MPVQTNKTTLNLTYSDMMQIAKDMRSLLWVLLSATLIASCASIGNPSGARATKTLHGS